MTSDLGPFLHEHVDCDATSLPSFHGNSSSFFLNAVAVERTALETLENMPSDV